MKSYNNGQFSAKKLVEIAKSYGYFTEIVKCGYGRGDAYLHIYSNRFRSPYPHNLYSKSVSREYLERLLDREGL